MLAETRARGSLRTRWLPGIASFLVGTVAASSGIGAELIPLRAGVRWTYAGQAETASADDDSRRSEELQWVTEILAVEEGPAGRAAVVRGFPDELAWWQAGQQPRVGILFESKERLFRLWSVSEEAARLAAAALARGTEAVPAGQEPLLELPLTPGRSWGGDARRDDGLYRWTVERKDLRLIDVPGLEPETREVATVSYRSLPDHQVLEVVQGVGLVRYVYEHHGAPATVDVRLVGCEMPGPEPSSALPAQPPAGETARGDDRLHELAWLVGEWQGYGEFSDRITYIRKVFAYDVGGVVLSERTVDMFPPARPSTEFEIHQDLVLFYRAGATLRARGFYVESFVTACDVTVGEDATIVVETTAVENGPPDLRTRYTITPDGPDRFTAVFEIARPGHDFEAVERLAMRRVY